MKNTHYMESTQLSLWWELHRVFPKLLLALIVPGTLGSAFGQAFLVKNINSLQETVGSAPAFFVPVGSNVFYFKANDGIHGTELWRSDGTAEGTALVADITSSSANADPASLVRVGTNLFFTATDVTHGRELWKSDGTEAGTILVKDINPGTLPSNPTNLTALGDLLFFASLGPTNVGNELWKSDGTEAGTVLVKDINPGAASSNPANLVVANDVLVFSANGGPTNGIELWKSDGTTSNTVMIKDIFVGPTSSNPQNLVTISNQFTTNTLVCFSAGSANNGIELWCSDGTADGTFMVFDINPGPGTSNPQNLVNVGGELYFSANRGVSTGVELWRSEGFFATALVADINPGPQGSNPQNLVNVNGTLFFTANSGTNFNMGTGTELWKFDVGISNLTLVKDILPGTGSSFPTNLINVGGALFFTANNGTNGAELWTSDGTQSGTTLVRDIRTGPLASTPQNLANFNGTLIFSADDGLVGRELWKSDGTEQGTVLIDNIRDSDASSSPTAILNLNGTLIFAANDGLSGAELWTSDGTLDGTVLLKDINPGANGSGPSNLVLVNNVVFFSADDGTHGRELWKTDGTEAGTAIVKDINLTGGSNPSSLVSFNGNLFFAANDGTNGAELWTSDGTDTGTVVLKNINPSSLSSNPTNFAVVSNTLFFSATTGTNVAELWKTDGTAANTTLVKGAIGSNPGGLVAFNGSLFFAANGSTNTGIELWMSDGTQTGTVLVKDINPGVGSSNPQGLTVVSNLLFFSATSVTNGNELWRSDGTAAGTVQIKDINPGGINSNPQNLINVNGTLFFTASGGASFGTELWKSDGTAAGTVMVKDINPLSASSAPQNLFNVNGRLFFSATDGVNGRELWQSDGTEDGTFMVADITEDSNDSNPGPFTVLRNSMFFAAQTSAIGIELFGFVLNHPPTVANPIPDQESVFGSAFTFIVPPDTFEDEDAGQLLTYSVSGLPPGISFVAESNSFSGTLVAAGQFTVTVIATDNGVPLPLSATNTFVVTVHKATPVITWPTPSDIVYGTALSAAQLNATASFAGAFSYSPPAGTVLHVAAGQVLSVTFSPEDTNNVSSANAEVAINVVQASLTATAADKSRNYGAANPSLTINYSGFVNGDGPAVLDAAPVASTSATSASPVGAYPITLSGGSDNDYSFVLVNGTLHVELASLVVTANNASKVYGQPNPTFTGSISGLQNSDNITATYSSVATDTRLAGFYPIVPSLVDPDSKLGNYAVTLINGTLTITPAALTVTILSPDSGFVQAVNTNILFTGSFTRSGASDSYLAYWTFSSDGLPDVIVPGIVSNDTVSAQIEFDAAGVYNFTLTVTNEFGPSAVATNVANDLPAYVVIYDPDGGFVTGGGWFNSPAGAYVLDPNLIGKASFGFVSKYQHGASIPSGQTQFKFQAGDLNFHSTSYDWLVISGSKAQYQGSGTINGEGDYAFKLTAVDGQVNGGGGSDLLRMKIWEKEHHVLIYDNQLGASDGSNPTTIVQGSIVIHKE